MHIAGKKNVADYFSRVPGYDALTDSPQLCSMMYTFGVPHGLDLPVVHEVRLKEVRCPTCGHEHVDKGRFV